MQRAGMRGFNRSQRGGGTIKDRLGFKTQSARQKGGLTTTAAGKRAVKSRLGGVAAATIGQILDARQKINLNRVKTGRVGDARDKIEAKRRVKQPPVGRGGGLSGGMGGGGGTGGGQKFKNLTITANLGPPLGQSPMARSGGGGGGYYPEEQHRPGARFTSGYPMESSGMFRSAQMDAYNSPGPSGNSFSHDDGLFLTRTISNPAAVANTYAQYNQRSPLQSKPNVYRPPTYSSRFV